jgi:hypothetical protein
LLRRYEGGQSQRGERTQQGRRPLLNRHTIRLSWSQGEARARTALLASSPERSFRTEAARLAGSVAGCRCCCCWSWWPHRRCCLETARACWS